MPERLNRVDVVTGTQTITLSWEGRNSLLAEISHLPSLDQLRHEFESAGASRPVKIPGKLKGKLAQAIDEWTNQTPNGYRDLPVGVWDLRNALKDDLDAWGARTAN